VEGEEEPELAGEPGVVRIAYGLAMLLSMISGLALAAAVLLVFVDSSGPRSGLRMLAVSAVLLGTAGAFTRGHETARILMAGLSVAIMIACGVLIVPGVSREGLASSRVTLVVPLVFALAGAVVFIHPEVRAWAFRRRASLRGPRS
jgi:hypothetical protein